MTLLISLLSIQSLAIVKGKIDINNKFPSVVKILINSGNNTCSGTLISDQMILTASHCISDSIDSYHQNLKAIIRDNRGQQKLYKIKNPTKFNIHPGFHSSKGLLNFANLPMKLYYDIGYLELEEPLDMDRYSYSPINIQKLDAIQMKESITAVGYGLTKVPRSLCLDPNLGRFCFMQNKKGHFTPSLPYYASMSINVKESLEKYLYQTKQRRFFIFKSPQGIWGDSGGPIFNEDGEIIATIRGGEPERNITFISKKEEILYSYFLPTSNEKVKTFLKTLESKDPKVEVIY